MMNNIFNFFNYKSVENVLSDAIKKNHSIIPTDDGGGCSHQKALLMSVLIAKFKIKRTADIGVYRGRSLFPQVIAHKLYSKGIAFGIDPYSKDAAIQFDKPELQHILDEFILNTDFNELYERVSEIIESNKYQEHCMIVRKKSTDAVSEFINKKIKFGLIHIDGNHDAKFVMEDVHNYLPLLEDKSFIVLDDVSWNSVKPAYSLLKNEMILIDEFIYENNDFALFGKGFSVTQVNNLKKLFKKIKSLKV
ncbi:class I SAM-dependent methyltransferase [Flavobacterium sp. XN-5]|uniref:class I SAM-dependent methyltransferase n=1 Tax=Flavobacterium sp. XN-5 TaxID=2599390 RepID=UPI0011CA256D|nr:class I SAM-dependent methyltransferase [Flavobacterium sp. XN-5]NGY37441.1 class I SAM-dependent methyltransferase [Flavobacterium sp. XN-5]